MEHLDYWLVYLIYRLPGLRQEISWVHNAYCKVKQDLSLLGGINSLARVTRDFVWHDAPRLSAINHHVLAAWYVIIPLGLGDTQYIIRFTLGFVEQNLLLSNWDYFVGS